MNKITTIIVAAALVAPAILPAADSSSEYAKAKNPHAFAKIFDGRLVDANGKSTDTKALAKAPYKLVYFSAHWCPPCRAFTPKLVKYVNETRKDGNFEIIFVSSDKSKKDMLAYMKEADMPWSGTLKKGLKIDGLDAGSNGIPCLRVFDKDGKMILDSYDESGEYRGPGAVLADFTQLLAKEAK